MSELLDFLTTHKEQFRKTRLGALYSDFRPLRTLNPDGYTANIDAWCKGLADAAIEGHIPNRGSSSDTLVLNFDEELLRALEHPEWGRPLALGTVVRDAIAKNEMIPIAEYQTSQESIYSKPWTYTPWGIISWGLRQLRFEGGSYGEDHLPSGKLVILSNVEDASKALARRIAGYTSRTDRIISKEMFYRDFANIFGDTTLLSQIDMDVLLKYISREKNMAAYDGQIVKFAGSLEAKPPKITSEDATIASLKTLMTDLEVQINVLANQVDGLIVIARDAVLRKNRVSALSALRSKKMAESKLSTQSAALAQLEAVYSRISQASDQVDLVRIMEGSTGVLKSLNAEVGGVAKVDDVVDKLSQQMLQVDEISSILAEPGQTAATIDDIEVNKELEEMELEDKKRTKDIERKAENEKKRKEIEVTRRRLEELETVERNVANTRRQEPRQTSPTRNEPECLIRENTTRLAQRPLDEEASAAPAI